MQVVKGMKLNDFKLQVRLMLSEDMSTVSFRVYRFPQNFSCISQRTQVSNDSDFDACIEQLWDLNVPPPELYVWNVDREGGPSPTLLPLIKGTSKVDEKSDSSGKSRSTVMSNRCKLRDDYACICCGFCPRDVSVMQACHLFDISSHSGPKSRPDRDLQLGQLGLDSINDLENLVTMCRTCHKAFDSHKLGIHSTDQRWIVVDVLRNCIAKSKKKYSSYHGKPVVFATDSAPPPLLLAHLMSRFISKNEDDNPRRTVHYCHFCPDFFNGEAGIGKLQAHLKVCANMKQAKVDHKSKRSGTEGKRKTGDRSVAATATSRSRDGGATGGSRDGSQVIRDFMIRDREAVRRGRIIPDPTSESTNMAALYVKGGLSWGSSTKKRKSKEAETLPGKKRKSTANTSL